jgi:hypothetical protein
MALQEVGRAVETGLSWLRISTGGGYLYGKELSGSIKCGEFLDWLQRLVIFSRRTVLHGVSK